MGISLGVDSRLVAKFRACYVRSIEIGRRIGHPEASTDAKTKTLLDGG